jgi:hypothetical protein
VPVYYFHIHNDDVTIDEEGVELSDRTAAVACAVNAARSLAAEDVLRGRLRLSDRIVIEDENHRLVREVRFDEAVQIGK